MLPLATLAPSLLPGSGRCWVPALGGCAWPGVIGWPGCRYLTDASTCFLFLDMYLDQLSGDGGAQLGGVSLWVVAAVAIKWCVGVCVVGGASQPWVRATGWGLLAR
ncbi:hypothetical protein AMECASPLE_019142 [Ameca splendens]|uniref:Secreted protein n=1 Tax=Ameca splendens TaxID=208324 RepID=A0ABV0XS29_9TELE